MMLVGLVLIGVALADDPDEQLAVTVTEPPVLALGMAPGTTAPLRGAIGEGLAPERLGREELEIPETTLSALDPTYTNLTSVFQFLIANTDFSPIAAAPGESCCHNGKLIGRPGQPIYAVPYDFDMSGFVDAPYATPNPRFGLRNVKQRLYRGRCVNNEYVPATLEHFRDHREEIIDLINQGEIDRAIGLCNETLERFPRDVNILGLLGAIYLKQNRDEYYRLLDEVRREDKRKIGVFRPITLYPFPSAAVRELAARVRAVLRRVTAPPTGQPAHRIHPSGKRGL